VLELAVYRVPMPLFWIDVKKLLALVPNIPTENE
jgi:hypothetical protein